MRAALLDRFDVDVYYDAHRGTPGRMYCREASFINDAEMFDHQFFSVGPAEASVQVPAMAYEF